MNAEEITAEGVLVIAGVFIVGVVEAVFSFFILIVLIAAAAGGGVQWH